MMHTVAATYGVLGKAQPVLTWLRKASTNGLPVYPVYRDDPHFECMRSQPQFLRFMATSKKSGHLSSESLEVQFASTRLKWNCGERESIPRAGWLKVKMGWDCTAENEHDD
jgi:hypothetical protein